MGPADRDTDRALDEFKETTSMHRFEAGLMFGQLTVHLAVFGVLFSKVITEPPPMRTIVIGTALVGLWLSLAFLVIHLRAAKHMLAVIRHGEILEQRLGMSLYACRPVKKTPFSGINTLTFIYIIGIVSWIVILVISAVPPN